jgi:acyl dehydratase
MTHKSNADRYWEDLSVNDTFATTGITVSEAHLVNWAGLTGDIVQFHLDEEFAKNTRFGSRIAHGPLTMSLALGLSTQTGYLTHVVAWLGLDALKAHRPVFIGDTITATVTTQEARPSSREGQGIWVLNYSVTNQRGEEVMSFVSSLMVQTRPENG